MKFLFTTFLIALFLVSCKSDKTQENNESEKLTLEGVWEMTGYYNYQDNKITDSFLSSDNYKQIKIYTANKVMWSRLNRLDSTDWFGYGDYKITDSTLHETLSFGSNSMNQAIDINNEFDFELILNKNTFNQIQLDENGDRVLSENYVRIE